MNEQDMRNESQKYLDEMMKFYSMNKNASISTQENNIQEPVEDSVRTTTDELKEAPPESVSLENETSQIKEDIADEELNEPNPEEMEFEELQPQPVKKESESIENRFPTPVIPEFIRQQSEEPSSPNVAKNNSQDYSKMSVEHTSENANTPYTDYGFLKVETRTGDNGIPVPNAAITVVRKNGNEEELVFSGVTNESGSIEKIKLPAPVNLKTNSPESFQNYAIYTVSAFLDGFYREISADVPVFAGVTSIQRFNLIPMPFNFDDNGKSIVFENTEPIF